MNIATVVVIWLLFVGIRGQHTVANITLKQTFFSSPGYIDDLHYGPNTTRDYRFHTYYNGHTLLLTVIEFVLEDNDKNGDCLYDKLEIYDGYDENDPKLVTLCGTIATGTNYSTTGNIVYVVFKSDATRNYKGFQFSVVSHGLVFSSTTIKSSTSLDASTSNKQSSSQSTTDTSVIQTSVTTKPSTHPTGHSLTTAFSTPSKTTLNSATISIETTKFTPIPSKATSTTFETTTTSTTSESFQDDTKTKYTNWVIIAVCILSVVLIIVIAVLIHRVLKKKTSARKKRATAPSPNYSLDNRVGNTSFESWTKEPRYLQNGFQATTQFPNGYPSDIAGRKPIGKWSNAPRFSQNGFPTSSDMAPTTDIFSMDLPQPKHDGAFVG